MESTSIKYHQSLFQAQIDKDTVESTREITFVIAAESTGKQHRNRFMYNWSNWSLDKFNSNPIVGYQHNVYGDNMCLPPNPDDVIAKASAWIDTFKGQRSLMSKATFEPAELNQTAEKVFQKIRWGSLNASSTGILPTGQISTEIIKNDKMETVDVLYHFPGQELVEWSVVHIPADPAALRRSLKSHTMAALQFVQKLMEDLSLSDIKKMKVQDVLDAIDGKYTGAPLEEMEQELSGPDPNLNNYISKLNRLKNESAKK